MKLARFFGLSGLIWTVLGAQTFAMCIWFAPPGRIFEPATNIKTLVAQGEEQQTIVVQPQFQGTATDFALLMPFPSEPTVEEAPVKIFKQLENLTNPIQTFDDFPIAATAESSVDGDLSRGVEVIEERDVGDFTVTTLSATSADALVDWLNENDYEITDEKLEVIKQYIGGESSFFVALKINIDNAEVNRDGLLSGELKPIQFSFSAEDVMLPLRLMAEESGDIFDLVIYTLSAEQLYVPGAEIQFARKITGNDIEEWPTLARYNAQSQWLTRNSISLDTSKVKRDLSMYKTPADVVVEEGDESIRVNPDLLDPRTGLVESDFGTINYVDASDDDQVPSKALEDEQTRPLIVITVLLGIANIFLINTVLKMRSRQPLNDDQE